VRHAPSPIEVGSAVERKTIAKPDCHDGLAATAATKAEQAVIKANNQRSEN
jgi:hypothetical protein